MKNILYPIIFLFIFSCSGIDTPRVGSGMPSDEYHPPYCDSGCIDAKYINYMDTNRWFNGPLYTFQRMLHPIIKINMAKPNDMRMIYKQLDSAVTFAQAIGFYDSYYWAYFTYQGNSYYYESMVEGYMDTAKWIGKADKYLRDKSMMGISTSSSKADPFLLFDTEEEYDRFVDKCMKDSVTYIVFSINRIGRDANSKKCDWCLENFSTYGGRKVKESSWKKRQTKPYPRRP